MVLLIGETASESFVLQSLASGQTFSRTSSFIDGAPAEWNPDFSDLGGGSYRYSYVPLDTGAYEWAGSAGSGDGVAINFEVESSDFGGGEIVNRSGPTIHSLSDLGKGPPAISNVPIFSNVGWRNDIATIFNVRAFGAVGDGVTDDGPAIKATRDAIFAVGAGRMFFPPGTYQITAPIDIDMHGIMIEGLSRGTVIIRQATSNTPIFRWTGDLGATLNNVFIERLTLTYVTQQTTTDTLAYGIMVRSNAAGTATSVGGMYLCAFRDVTISKAYTGFGIFATGAGTFPVWGNLWENIYFQDIIHNAVDLVQGGSMGQPANCFNHIHVLNYNATSDGTYCFDFSGNTGLVMTSINVEDWQERLVRCNGGYLVINGFRTERIDVSTASMQMFSLAAGNYVINGVSLPLRMASTAFMTVFTVNTSATLHLSGVQVIKDIANSVAGGNVSVLWGDPATCVIVADGIVADSANGIKLMQPSGFGTGQYTVASLNGMPPAWNALPTAAVAYRGRLARIEGGAGVADVSSQCLKSAADTYSWVAI